MCCSGSRRRSKRRRRGRIAGRRSRWATRDGSSSPEWRSLFGSFAFSARVCSAVLLLRREFVRQFSLFGESLFGSFRFSTESSFAHFLCFHAVALFRARL